MSLDLAIKISADTAAARAGIEQVRDGVTKLQGAADQTAGGVEKLGGTLNRLGGLAAGLLVGLPALQRMAGQVTAAADAVTIMRNRLELATGSAASAARAFDSLYSVAQKSRTSFTELGGVYATMARAGVQNIAVVQAIGNAMAIGGGSADSMRAALVQLGQGMASGVLRGEELNSILEQAPRLAQAMADGLGVPIGSLRRLGEEGQLTTQRVTEALLNSAPKLADELAKSTMTVGQAFTVLGNATTRFISDADQAAGTSSALSSAISGVSEAVDGLGKVIREHETAFSILAGSVAGVAVVGGVLALKAGLAALIPIAAGAAAALGPVGAAIAAAAAAIGAAVAAWRAWKGSAGGMEKELARLEGSPSIYDSAEDRDPALRAAKAAQLRQRLALASGGGLDTRAEDARLERSRQEFEAREKLIARSLEIRRQLSGEDQKYTKLVGELNEMLKAGAISQQQYNEMKRQAWQQTKQGADEQRKAADEAEKRLKSQMEAERQQLAWQKEYQDEQFKRWKADQERYDAAEAAADAQVRYAKDAVASIQRETAMLKMSNVEREITVALLALEAKGVKKGTEAYEQYAEQVRKAIVDREAVKESIEQTNKIGAEWKRATDDIERSLTDALMRGFESGRGFLDSLVSSIKSAFKTMVLQPMVRAIVQPMVGALGFGGAGSAMAGGASGGMGGIGGGMNLLSSLSNFGNFGTIVNGGIVGGAQTAFLRMGDWLSTSQSGMANSVGGFLQSNYAGLGSAAGAAGGFMFGRTLGQGISGGYSALGGGSGNSAVNIGSAIGSIFGPLGGVIGGAIGGLVNRAFGMKAKEATGTGITGTASVSGFSGNTYTDWFQKGGWFRSDKSGTDFGAVGSELQGVLNSGIGLLYAAAGQYAQVLGLPVASVQNYSRQFKVAWGDSEEENKKAVEDALVALGNDLAAQYRAQLAPLQKAGESLSGTLGRLAELQTFSATLNEMGGIFSRIAGASVSAREEMIALAGGMETFGQLAMGFVQDYYGRDEIAGLKANEVASSLQAVGLDVGGLKTRGDYRSLLESLDPASTTGRTQIAALLGAAGQFAQVSDYLGETGLTLGAAAAQSPATGVLQGMFSTGAAQLEASYTANSLLSKIADLMQRVVDGATSPMMVTSPVEVYNGGYAGDY